MTIKELREKNKLSQAKLAKVLGVSGATIASIEAGQRKVSAKISKTVKEVYGEVIEVGTKVEEKVEKKAKETKARVKASKKKTQTGAAVRDTGSAPASAEAPAKKDRVSKSDLVRKLAEQNKMSQKTAAAVVDSVLNTIMETVAAGEPVSLLGFGTFSVKHRDERQGRNPATGEPMTFEATDVPVFKAGKSFKEKV